MDSIIYLATRYVLFHRVKSLILILCVTFSIFLPIAGKTVLDRVERELRARAVTTPYVVGAKGSRYDLVLHALYFDVLPPESITYSVYREIRKTGAGETIPVYRNHLVQENVPLVGVGLEYFDYRQLELDQGSWFGRIGHCVIGCNVARKLQVGVGDKLISKPENAVNLAGATPVRMEIVGVMKPGGSSDDETVFTDLKTTWLIDGLGHGHQDIEKEKDSNLFLEKNERSATLNQGVLPYIEITDENVSTVHFHGDPGDFPLTALILVPRDEKSATMLEGEIESQKDSGLQMVEPRFVIQQLVERILRVKKLFDFGSVTIVVITLLFLTLNTLLSIRLRQREMTTMFKIGCGRFTILGLFIWEYLIVILIGLGLSVSLTFGCVQYLQQVILQAIR